METRPYVSWDLVGSFMVDAFQAAGIPEADAKICADVLMESDRRGIESHGTNRFKPIYIDRINDGILNPVTNYEILKETPTTLVADAHDGMGMVASHKMMTSLIEKAKTHDWQWEQFVIPAIMALPDIGQRWHPKKDY